MKKNLINPLYENISNELKIGRIISIDVIETLWSGYGEIVRLKSYDKSIIVKHVKLPKRSKHPKGWNTKFSHNRKLHSYKVEVNWYEEFSSIIDNRCRIPQGFKTFHTQDEYLIVMEDLFTAGYVDIVTEPTLEHLKTSVCWLANFHAKYMGIRSDKIWEEGTYWHLNTRPDELEALEDKELKSFAEQIDYILKNTKYQTLVHGDAKLANFCFSQDGTKASAVDFQYVGHGCGMKDLVLFMSSSIKPEDCVKMESWVIDIYFKELKEALNYYQPKLNSAEVEKEWRPLFSISWADFQRFIKGWSPSHYKINLYTECLTKKALEYLRLIN